MFGTGIAVEVLNLDLLEGFDILADAKFFDILKRALRGEFDFIVSGTPCCTFSAALAATSDAHNAGTVLRSASSPMGRPNLSEFDQKKVDDHNEITLRGVVLELAVWLSGGEAITENPAFRGDESSRFYWKEKAHVGGLLWKMPCIQRLQRATGAAKVDFAQCAFKAKSQKATTLLYTPGLNMVEFHKIGNGLRERQQCDCAAGAHKITALGGESAASARYPTLMNRALAKAIVLSFKARRDERERVKKYPPFASSANAAGRRRTIGACAPSDSPSSCRCSTSRRSPSAASSSASSGARSSSSAPRSTRRLSRARRCGGSRRRRRRWRRRGGSRRPRACRSSRYGPCRARSWAFM